MKALATILLVSLSTHVGFAFADDTTPSKVKTTEYDLRKVRWGMTHQQVVKSEVWKRATFGKKTIVYKGSMLGLECLIQYAFHKGGLSTAVYAFLNPTVGLHTRLKGLLTDRYGDPVPMGGDVMGWKAKGRTYILLSTSADGKVGISYMDKRVRDAQDKAEADDAKSAL